MKAHTGTYYIIVVENVKLGKIVACGSLIVEQKFIHETALVSYEWYINGQYNVEHYWTINEFAFPLEGTHWGYYSWW